MNELKFFEKYCDDFNTQNIETIGDYFSGPVTFFLPDGNSHTFNRRRDLDSNTRQLFEIYNELGFITADFNLLSVIKLADWQNLCQLKWALLDKQSKVLLKFETAYLLSGAPGNYSITAVFVNSEVEALRLAQEKKPNPQV